MESHRVIFEDVILQKPKVDWAEDGREDVIPRITISFVASDLDRETIWRLARWAVNGFRLHVVIESPPA